jgi:DNA processing protein
MGFESSAMTKYWMALGSVRGVGPKTIRMLISRFGSLENVLSAPLIEIARMPRLDLQLAHEIIGVKGRLLEFEKFIAHISAAKIRVLCPDSPEYPHLLNLIEDFPPILYSRGEKLSEDKLSVAIVGTRSPSSDGAKAAEAMAEWLAKKGITVVSGLANGIDTAAHMGALKADGKTLAVLGSGLRMVYPRENYQLARDICVKGALLSECHPNEVVSGQRLIQRNRIISGLSLGMILVEPGNGAINAANWALKQGRDIFIYKTCSEIALPQPLSEIVSPINKIDELYAVIDQLKMPKSGDNQMCLL